MLKHVVNACFIILCCLMQMVNGQNLNSTGENNYVITNWTMSDGLPQSSVNDIVQGDDGYIWLATFGGLVRFDGKSFKVFSISNTPGMRSNRILHVYEDRKQDLWVAYENGLMKFDGDSWKTYYLKMGSMNFAPSNFAEDDAGRLWITSHGEVYLYKNDMFVQKKSIDDEELRQQALEDRSGVWMPVNSLGAGNHIIKTLDDKVVLIDDLKQEVESQIVDVVEYPTHSGNLFLATDGEGVIRYNTQEGITAQFSTKSGLPSRYVSKLYIDRTHQLWVTNFDGISRWDGETFKQLNGLNVDGGVQFTKIIEDVEGNYWIGSPNQGLYQARPTIISMIDEFDGIDVTAMLSLTALSDGSYLFATNCGGVYRWKNGKIDYPKINKHLPNKCIWSVFEDSRGDIWYGSRVLYRSSSPDEEGVRFGKEDGYTGFEIFAITEDTEGQVWIGCYNGLYRYNGKRFDHFTTEQGLGYNEVRTLFEDSNGDLWIGTTIGLNKMVDGKITPVMLREAKDSEEPYVRAIYEDETGAMWIGTYGDGIFRIDADGSVANITTDQGLFDDIVSHFMVDEYENVWMGSNRGVARVSLSDLRAVADGDGTYVAAYSYDKQDGMNSSETNGGFQPNAIQNNGTIMIPSVDGVIVVNANTTPDNLKIPPVYIEEVTDGQGTRFPDENIQFSYDDAVLEINYTALNFRDPDKIQFKYTLEGLNDTWFELGNRRTVLLTNIPPGTYTFRVTAGLNENVWNTAGASIGIEVTPPFWQTNWFYALAMMSIIGVVGGGYYTRIRALEKENQRQKHFSEQLIDQQEYERQRIASDLHDGIGQQVLIIQNRAELAELQIDDKEALVKELSNIRQSANNSLEDIRNISHNLRPVILEKFGLTESIVDLCNQLQNYSDVHWEYRIDGIDELIPAHHHIHLYRVIQEATKNILKHAQATQASVFVEKQKNALLVKITDKGIGMDLHKQDEKAGLGYVGMRERMKTLNGTMTVKSKPGKGMRVVFNINLEQDKDE